MSEVLTVSEAAREIARSAQNVRDLADSGKLPAMRTVGGQRIFRRVDVEQFRLERDGQVSAAVSAPA